MKEAQQQQNPDQEPSQACPDAGKTPGGRECPPPAKMCEYINDYMCWWKKWADAIHDEVFPGGNPTDPEPPPWPPFQG